MTFLFQQDAQHRLALRNLTNEEEDSVLVLAFKDVYFFLPGVNSPSGKSRKTLPISVTYSPSQIEIDSPEQGWVWIYIVQFPGFRIVSGKVCEDVS